MWCVFPAVKLPGAHKVWLGKSAHVLASTSSLSATPTCHWPLTQPIYRALTAEDVGCTSRNVRSTERSSARTHASIVNALPGLRFPSWSRSTLEDRPNSTPSLAQDAEGSPKRTARPPYIARRGSRTHCRTTMVPPDPAPSQRATSSHTRRTRNYATRFPVSHGGFSNNSARISTPRATVSGGAQVKHSRTWVV